MSQNGRHTPVSVQLRITGTWDTSFLSRLHRCIPTLSVAFLEISCNTAHSLSQQAVCWTERSPRALGPKSTEYGAQWRLRLSEARLGDGWGAEGMRDHLREQRQLSCLFFLAFKFWDGFVLFFSFSFVCYSLSYKWLSLNFVILFS